jgi:hypothetical protein
MDGKDGKGGEGHVESSGGNRNAHRVLMGKAVGKR